MVRRSMILYVLAAQQRLSRFYYSNKLKLTVDLTGQVCVKNNSLAQIPLVAEHAPNMNKKQCTPPRSYVVQIKDHQSKTRL